MYMATIATHMSMQDKTMRIADAISNVGTEYGVGARCRGMLAGPPQGNTGGMHGLTGGGGEVEGGTTSHQEASMGGLIMPALQMRLGHRVVEAQEVGGMEMEHLARVRNEAPPPLVILEP